MIHRGRTQEVKIINSTPTNGHTGTRTNGMVKAVCNIISQEDGRVYVI